MLKYPDHVGQLFLMKIEEYVKIGKEKSKHNARVSACQTKQDEIIGEIKGILQAEEHENEQRENKPEAK